jgi:2-polyprenyl-3-methyl-5-hydroxy-6-metoxy-1,4-benzoquinol methylase
MATKLAHPQGTVVFDETPKGNRVSVHPNDATRFVSRSAVVTSYPLALVRQVLAAKGLEFLCDEIARDEYVRENLRWDVLSYAAAHSFTGSRVIDFGCGAGASTVALARMLPGAEIVGLELEASNVAVARARAEHYGLHNVRVALSPSPDALPPDLGAYDHVVMSAVYEHLLPAERRILLPLLWRGLKPGGALFIGQLPHRFSPVESHTTGLPLLNYLPDGLAFWAARHFSRRSRRDHSWEAFLRYGIRGGTVREITGLLGRDARVVRPCYNGVRDRVDLWYARSSSMRWGRTKRGIRAALKLFQATTGIAFVPTLALAIRKAGG